MSLTYSQGLERALRRAAAIAKKHDHESATPEDLLLALIDDEDTAGVMRGCGIDFERLRDDLAACMESAPNQADAGPVEEPAEDLYPILRKAHRLVKDTEREIVTTTDVLIELFTEPVGYLLQKQGMTLHGMLTYISHGAKADAALLAPGNTTSLPLELLLLNDPYTPMEFVVRVLEDVFRIEHERAVEIMLATHENGEASCGVYELAECQKLAGQVMQQAREHQFPLRCVARPARPSD